MNQKNIKGWHVVLETKMAFPISEAYGSSTDVNSLVGLIMAKLCESSYSVHMVLVEMSITQILVDKAFSVLKRKRLAQVLKRKCHVTRKIG